MCTGVDAQECARMADVLSEEIAVLAEENALRAEENAVQAGEIARLRGLLETHTLHGNQRVNHEKVLEPKDIVDHSSHGTLCSLLLSGARLSGCLLLSGARSTASSPPSLLLSGCGSFDSCYLTFFPLPILRFR